MIQFHKVNDSITQIEITSPRSESDENQFMGFLNEVIQKSSFGFSLYVEGSAAFSPEAKRELTKWFKDNKPILRENCFGFARINKDATKMTTLKSKAMRLAMPCPYIVLPSSDQARDWLLKAHV